MKKRFADAAAVAASKATEAAKRLDTAGLIESAVDGAGLRDAGGRVSARRSMRAAAIPKVTIPKAAMAVGREAYRQLRDYQGDPMDQPPPPLPGAEPLGSTGFGGSSLSQLAASGSAAPAPATGSTVASSIEAARQESVFDGRCETAWASVVQHLQSDDRRYVVEHADHDDAIFWAEILGYWHRMVAVVVDPGFSRPPHVQVEFHMGNLDEVDIVTLSRGSAPDVVISGVLVLDNSVRLFANRTLATLDTADFDEMVASVNGQIAAYCSATGGSPPPGGNWAVQRPDTTTDMEGS